MTSELLNHWSDSVALIYTTIISVFGFVLNMFLLLIMMNNTPSTMKTYSIVIRLGVICDIFSSIATFLVSTRIFMTDGSLFFMFQGLCTNIFKSHDRLVSSQVCFYLYYSELHFFIFSQFILIYSYIYRYRVVTMPFEQVSKKKVQMTCYIFTILFIIYYNWTFYMAISTQEEIDNIVRVARPELINSPILYNGIVNHDHPVHQFVSFITILSSLIVPVVAGYCSYRVNRILKKTQTSTRNPLFHKSLLNVLLAQTISPIIAVLALLLFAHNSITKSQSPVLENMILIPNVTITVITPIVTMLFIPPYKTAVNRIFGKKTISSFRSVSESFPM